MISFLEKAEDQHIIFFFESFFIYSCSDSPQEKYLHDKVKVAGKAGNLTDSVTITKHGVKGGVATGLQITTTIEFSKRYLKYLTKRFLKKNKLRDWLHVVAVTRNKYELRYFNISEIDQEAMNA